MTLPKLIRACLIMATSILVASCGGGSGGSGGSSGSTPTVPMFSLGGTVTGLASSDQVVFQVVVSNSTNSSDTSPTATIKGTSSETGSFITPAFVPSGGSFIILVATQPTGKICTVSNGAGTNVTADVTNISVVCSATTYSVSVTTTGLLPGQQVVLLNNSADPLSFTTNTTSTFVTPIASGGGYDITVKTEPLVTTCSISNSTASSVTANVTNISVTCGPANADAWQYSFGSPAGDASQPEVGLLQGANHLLYGVSGLGGATNNGAIFSIATTGGSDSVIHSFGGTTAGDGACPQASLIQGSDGNFYGTTCLGGANNYGTVYKLTSAGTVTVLHSFNLNADGGYPYAALLQNSDGLFYGSTSAGGAGGVGYGTAFKIDSSGNFTQLYGFGSAGMADAKNPHSALVAGPDGNLYGTTVAGGNSGNGTVYRLNLATNSVTVMHSFGSGSDGNMTPSTTPHHDQAAPLLLNPADDYFYGTTPTGGTSGTAGTVYKIHFSGLGYSVMYNFAGGTTDGQNSQSGLILATDGAFYGTTVSGGTYNGGTIFRITPAAGYNLMYSFGSGDGQNPVGALIQANDGHLYGTTFFGGQFNQGIVFKF